MKLSRGILGLPLLMLAFGIHMKWKEQQRPVALLLEAQSLERTGHLTRAAGAYQRLVSLYPGSTPACRALWELASMQYSVRWDREAAVRLLQKLIHACSDDALAGEAMLMIADIHEIDLRDLEQSNRIRRDYLELVSDSERIHETLFKIGDVLFKQGRYPESRETLESLLELDPAGEIATQANLRIGTILQVGQDYDRSIRYFEAAIKQSRSPEYRLQARLGLIESYEFLDQLELALKVAHEIRPEEYPSGLKNDILTRLTQKRMHSSQY